MWTQSSKHNSFTKQILTSNAPSEIDVYVGQSNITNESWLCHEAW